jgi:hypothetical protein
MRSNGLGFPVGVLLIGLVFAGLVCQPGFGGPTEQAKLIASLGPDGDRFGTCTAIDGNYAVVGAPYDDDKGNNSGAAYVLELVGGELTAIVQLSVLIGMMPTGPIRVLLMYSSAQQAPGAKPRSWFRWMGPPTITSDSLSR